MQWWLIVLACVGVCAVSLLAWRVTDLLAERRAWQELRRRAAEGGPAFDPAVVADLPEPARRYFRYTIAPGTPLTALVELEMAGQLGLGTKAQPRYGPMTARQILAPPYGLVWQVHVGALSGSDATTPATSWTRFWLLHLIPVVRVSGTSDHHRSAFGRVVSEGAFWAPASLLPAPNVSWTGVDGDTARATVRYGEYSQSVDVTLESDGRPSRVLIQRWSNANADKIFREQPFGGYLSDFRDIGGYRVPMRVEGGNLIGTEDYFPFFKAEVRSIRFGPRVAAR